MKCAVKLHVSVTYHHATIIFCHPHVSAKRVWNTDVVKYPILQNETALGSGAVDMISSDITCIVNSPVYRCGRARVINLGEMPIVQQKSVMVTICVVNAPRDVAASVHGAR